MKKLMQALIVCLVAIGAYGLTLDSTTTTQDGEVSSEVQVELGSSAQASPDNAGECYTKCNQPCYRCEKACPGHDGQCRSDCYARADSCARSYGFKGHAHGGNSCNNACM